MMIALPQGLCWVCDACFQPIHDGIALHGESAGRGHFPHVKVCCGVECASRLANGMAGPVKRMAWATFLEALTAKEPASCSAK